MPLEAYFVCPLLFAADRGPISAAPERKPTGDMPENKMENVSSMHTFTLGVTLFALVIQDGDAFAQQKQKEAMIVSGMTIEIDSKGRAVINSAAQPISCARASCNPNKWRKASRRHPSCHDYRSRGSCR